MFNFAHFELYSLDFNGWGGSTHSKSIKEQEGFKLFL